MAIIAKWPEMNMMSRLYYKVPGISALSVRPPQKRTTNHVELRLPHLQKLRGFQDAVFTSIV